MVIVVNPPQTLISIIHSTQEIQTDGLAADGMPLSFATTIKAIPHL